MKKIQYGALMLFAGALIAGTVFASPARAGFIGDFFKKLLSPSVPGAPLSDSATGITEKQAEEKIPSLFSPAIPAPKEPAPLLYRPAIDYENAVVAAVKKASPAVVSITVSKNVPVIEQCQGTNPFGDLPPEFRQFFGGDIPQFSVPCERGTKLQEVGGGSGFIISSDGLILTNKHVVLDEQASYTVLTNDGKKYDARVLARDPLQDLAVIKIIATGLSTVELGDSDTLALGQTAIAIGNSLGEFRNTVSVGVISGLARTVSASDRGGYSEIIEGVIQTDAAINPGNSGGPLLNLRGQVIGINTAVAQGAQSIGFAIPINSAKRDINSVKSSGEIKAPFLGVRYVIITPELAKAQKLAREYGALVRGTAEGQAVEANSPAEQAGIQAEDIILEFDGTKITREETLGSLIGQHDVGEIIQLKLYRSGKEIMATVMLSKRP
jgi:S1-C subfamily serine protease